jgi:hypothetical protein
MMKRRNDDGMTTNFSGTRHLRIGLNKGFAG